MSWILYAALGVALAGTPSADEAPIDPGTFAPVALRPAASAALAAPSARALAASPVADTTLAALGEDAGWRLRARAAAALSWRRDASLAEAITTLAPAVTRNGALRFTDPRLRSAGVAPLLVERLASGAGTSAERAALVDALRLSGGDWSEAVAGLLPEEADAAVRAQLVAALGNVEGDAPRPAILLAAHDPSGLVRAEALRAIGGREDGATYASVVTAALDDADAGVRARAARAVGWLDIAAGWDALLPLLRDPDAEVRLQVVGALERLDASAAAALPALRLLRADSDERVARAARRVAGQ